MSARGELLPWSVVVESALSRERYAEIAAAHAQRSLVARAVSLAPELDALRFDRAALVGALLVACDEAGSPPEARRAAERLADPRAVAVVTGQQPGFLGGPLYSFFKAIHAVALAREIERAAGRPVVALFWNHSDDHDIDETRGVSLPDASGDVQRIALDLGRGRPFLSDVLVPEDAQRPFDRVRELLPAGPDRERVIDLYEPVPGRRFAAEAARQLAALVGRLGLCVFEPRHLRVLLSRELARVAEDAAAGFARLERLARDLRGRAIEPPFDATGPPLLFQRTEAGRERVRFDGASFGLPSERRLEPRSMAEAIRGSPDDFTAGVASRLVVEALAIPVVAVVRGPAELAYSPSAAAFVPRGAGRPLPVEVPRFAATLVDAKLRDVLTGLGWSAAQVVRGLADDESSRRRERVPVETALEELERDADKRLATIRDDLLRADGNLARPHEKTVATVSSALRSLRDKLARAVDEREATGARRRKRARAWLRPMGALQERRIPIAPFLCAGIERRVDSLLDAVEPVPSGHRILSLDEDP